MTQRILQRLAVPFEFPVVFTRDVFNPANPELVRAVDRLRERRRHRVMVFVDQGVVEAEQGRSAHSPKKTDAGPEVPPTGDGTDAGLEAPPTGKEKDRGLLGRLERHVAAHADRLELAAPPRVVPGGEPLKNSLNGARAIIRDLLARHMDRQSFVFAIGGGAVLDAVGFAASLVHRGLRLVRLPTTVLAQCDSGVGVKTAVNFGPAKNLVGTFAPPFAVLNDFDFLATLPDRDWRGGIAEAFKVALIQDADFFRWLGRQAARLRARNAALMEQMIFRCARLHLRHIRAGGDPFELGRARPLDFGHWSAHRLETLTAYRLGHGQAVAIGLALDACYAARQGWLPRRDFEALLAGLTRAGLPVWCAALNRKDRRGRLDILQGLEEFREHLGGELSLTLPRGVGRRFEIHEVDLVLMEQCVEELKRKAQTQDTEFRKQNTED